MLAFGLLALRVQFLGGAIAWVGLAFAQQLERALAITVEAVRLEVAAIGRTLIPLHAEPAEALEDFLERFPGRSLLVGIVDAQDEFTPLWRANR